MSGTRRAAIRLGTEDIERARQRLEALGPAGDAALSRIAEAGQRAANAFGGVNQALAGDGLKSRAADIAAYGAELDRLRAKFDPVFAASKRYEATWTEIAQAEKVGALSATVAASARERLNAEYAAAIAPMQKVAQATSAAVPPLRDAATATQQTAYQMRALAMQMPDVVQGLLTGQRPFQVLIQQGAQVAQVTGGVGNALRTLVAYMGGPYVAAGVVAGTTLALLVARSADLIAEQRQLDVALRGVGRSAEVSATGLAAYARALEQQGVARDQARAIAGDLARTQSLSGTNAGRVVQLAPDLATALGVDTAAAAKQLTEAFSQGYDAVRKLDDALNVLSADQRGAIRTMLEHGERTKAADVLFEALRQRLTGLHDQALSPMDKALQSLRTNWTAFIDSIAQSRPVMLAVETLNQSVQGLGMMVGVGAAQRPAAQPGDAQEDQAATLFARREALQRRYAEVSGDPAASPRRAALPALEAEIGRLGQQIETLRTQRDQLRAGAAHYGASLPDSLTAAGPVGPEIDRQLKLLADSTLSYEQQMRVLRASLPDRARVRAEIQAENELRSSTLEGLAAEEFKRRRVAEVLASEGDARAQELAAISREGEAALTLTAAAEQGRAAMMRSRAESEAYAQAATQAGVSEEALAQALLNRAAAQEAAKGSETVVQLREQVAATQALIEAEAQGPRAAYYAAIDEKIRQATISLRAARDATTDPAIRAALDRQIQLTEEQTRKAEELAEVLKLKREISTDRDAIEIAQKELELLGKSASERERELATLRALQTLRRGGADPDNLTPEQRDYVQSKQRLAEASSEVRRQQSLYQELGSIGERAMNRIGDAAVSALLSGQGQAVNFGNVLRSVAASAAADLAKLGLVNPLLNTVFGGERASLWSLAGGAAGGGSGGAGGGGSGISNLFSLGGLSNLFSSGSAAVAAPSGISTFLFGQGAVGAYGPQIPSAGLFGTGGIESVLGADIANLIPSMGSLQGIFAGFGMGSMLGSLIANSAAQRTNAMIGAGLGSLLLGPLGGLIGGGIGGLIGPRDSVQGYGFRLQSSGWGPDAAPTNQMANSLLPVSRQFYNESGAQMFAAADQLVAATNAYLSQRGLTVGGVSVVGGNRNGADYSWADAGSLTQAFTRLRFGASGDATLNTALAGKTFSDLSGLQAFVEGFKQVQDLITSLTADVVPTFTQQLRAVNDNFAAARAKAAEFGVSIDGLAEAQARAIGEVEAARTETLRQSSVSVAIRRMAAEGNTLGAELTRQAEAARQEIETFGRSLDALAITAEDKANRLVQLEQTQAAERTAIISRYSEQAAQALRAAGSQIRQYLDTLASGTAAGASPTDRLASAQAAFDRDRTLAFGGDRDALGRITQTADALLAAGRDVYASGSGFQNLLGSVRSGLANLPVVQSYDAMMAGALAAIQQAVTAGTLSTQTVILPSGNVVQLAGGLDLSAIAGALGVTNQTLINTLQSLNIGFQGVWQNTANTVQTLVVGLDGVTQNTGNTVATLVTGFGGLAQNMSNTISTLVGGFGQVSTGLSNVIGTLGTGFNGVWQNTAYTVAAIVSLNTSLATVHAAIADLNTSLGTIHNSLVLGDGAQMQGLAALNQSLGTLHASAISIGAAQMQGLAVTNQALAIMNGSVVAAGAVLATGIATFAANSNTGFVTLGSLWAATHDAVASLHPAVVGRLTDINASLATVDRSIRDVNTSLATVHGAIVAGSGALVANVATLAANDNAGFGALGSILTGGFNASTSASVSGFAATVMTLGSGNIIAASSAAAVTSAQNATNTLLASYAAQAFSQRSQLLAEIQQLRAQVAALTQAVQQSAVLVGGEVRNGTTATTDAVLQVKSAIRDAA